MPVQWKQIEQRDIRSTLESQGISTWRIDSRRNRLAATIYVLCDMLAANGETPFSIYDTARAQTSRLIRGDKSRYKVRKGQD